MRAVRLGAGRTVRFHADRIILGSFRDPEASLLGQKP
jgi:hypothetical protein